MAKVQLKKEAFKKTNEEFYKLRPERKNRPLTNTTEDANLRAIWIKIYKKQVGQSAIKDQHKISSVAVCNVNTKKKTVYVYLYVTGAGGHGHAGLILEQNDGSYIRYSQAAENANLQGWDRYEYFAWIQKVVVRIRRFPKNTATNLLAPGSKMIQIPTIYPDSIQKAVDQYIADKTYYHVVTNNCADFVNDSINAANDVDVSDKTKPVDYYAHLKFKFPGCGI